MLWPFNNRYGVISYAIPYAGALQVNASGGPVKIYMKKRGIGRIFGNYGKTAL